MDYGGILDDKVSRLFDNKIKELESSKIHPNLSIILYTLMRKYKNVLEFEKNSIFL